MHIIVYGACKYGVETNVKLVFDYLFNAVVYNNLWKRRLFEVSLLCAVGLLMFTHPGALYLAMKAADTDEYADHRIDWYADRVGLHLVYSPDISR
jgi:hypothetical protein